MIQLLTAQALAAQPTLHDTLFKDRTAQFRDRLAWPVTVTEDGHEIDQYDALDPLYLVLGDGAGRHLASMRFLPSTGRTMLFEHFAHLTQGVRFSDPSIVECTRFCLSPNAPRDSAARLLSGAAETGLIQGWSHALGVFDARMLGVYRRLGWEPALLGTEGTGREAISAGLWTFDPETAALLRQRIAPAPLAA